MTFGDFTRITLMKLGLPKHTYLKRGQYERFHLIKNLTPPTIKNKETFMTLEQLYLILDTYYYILSNPLLLYN